MSLYFGRQRGYAPVRAEADRDDRVRETESGEAASACSALAPKCTITLGLRSPAPARNCQQEKQRGTVKEAQVGNGTAARKTQGGRNKFESSEQSKDQREDSADQA
jgi:hypothetical protein